MTREQQLQRFLADRLPRKISYDEVDGFEWKQGGDVIHDTEWDYIVRMVEETADSVSYLVELADVVGVTESIDDYSYDDVKRIACASWQQRAEALAKTFGVTI